MRFRPLRQAISPRGARWLTSISIGSEILAGHLREACRELGELAALGEKSFLAESRTINSAKYLLIVAAEAALDMCNHLAAKRGGRSPEDYADCMAILEELGILDRDLRVRMSKMARFRNLLVHLYWKVDDREVFRIVRDRLKDFDDYLTAIGRHLEASL